MKIAHYYHAFAYPGWEHIVDEYLNTLVGSGLHEEIESVRLGVVGDEVGRKTLITHIEERVPVTVIVEATSGWEQTTLNQMVGSLHDDDNVVMYAHTKSVTNPNDSFNINWRHTMLDVIIMQWRQRVQDLTLCESAGPCQMGGNPDQPPGIEIYGGNFWWARTELLRRLPPPRMETRWGAEGWLGQVPHQMLNVFPWGSLHG